MNKRVYGMRLANTADGLIHSLDKDRDGELEETKSAIEEQYQDRLAEADAQAQRSGNQSASNLLGSLFGGYLIGTLIGSGIGSASTQNAGRGDGAQSRPGAASKSGSENPYTDLLVKPKRLRPFGRSGR